jgi:hypothetical protein
MNELELLSRYRQVEPVDPMLIDAAAEAILDSPDRKRNSRRHRSGPQRRRMMLAGASLAAAAVVAGLVTAADSGHQNGTRPAVAGGPTYITARLMVALNSASGDVLVVTSHASAAAGTDTAKLDPGDRLELCDWSQWLWPAVPRNGDTVHLRWHYSCGDGLIQDEAVTMKSVQVIPGTSPSDSNLGNSVHGTGTVSCASRQTGGPEQTFTGNLPSPPTPPAIVDGRPVQGINPGPGITLGFPNTSVDSIISEVSAGDFRLVGPTKIQGRPAFELRFVDRLPGTKISSTVWIDPATYLPIQQTQHFDKSSISNITYTFDFVPATAANLAHLNLIVDSTAKPAQPSPTFCSVAYLPANTDNPGAPPAK